MSELSPLLPHTILTSNYGTLHYTPCQDTRAIISTHLKYVLAAVSVS